MEGPSLVIITEELARFVGSKVKDAKSDKALGCERLVGRKLTAVKSWGKHLLLCFGRDVVRVHFLMFGSYRIDETRDRPARLSLVFSNGEVNFYSCSAKLMDVDSVPAYDTRIDLMSPDWDAREVLRRVNEKERQMVCDVLMDQEIFAGLGNIIKNEVLFNLRMTPETLVADLGVPARRKLVKEAHAYCQKFYAWKKRSELKKNWRIFRKRKCGVCGGEVRMSKTGVLRRVSFVCPSCQSNATSGRTAPPAGKAMKSAQASVPLT